MLFIVLLAIASTKSFYYTLAHIMDTELNCFFFALRPL